MATGDPPAELPPDQDIAGLYGGPLGGFVAGRDALARTLRSAGRRDDAAAVKALRKPSVVAWSLDAARVADPAAVEALVAAVAALGAAQEGDGDLRAALAALRAAQGGVVDAAVAATAAHGQPVARDHVQPALLAVVSDPAALADLAAGHLAAIPPAGGLGVADLAGAPASAPAAAAERPARAKRPRAGIPRKAPTPSTTAAPGKADAPAPPRRVKGAADRVLARAETAAAAAAEAEAEAMGRADAADQAAREADRAADAARRRADAARRAADLARQKAGAASAARAHADERVAAARAALG
jgi:hypothetical protein